MSKLRTTTKVQLTIEVQSPTTWQPGCSARQIFVGEEKEAKRQAREYAEAKEKRSRSRFYTALKARDVAFVNETTIGP